MFWRVLFGIGGSTFIWTGASILFDDACQWVTWGREGSARFGAFVATCWPSPVDGAWTGTTAGLVSLIVGLAVVTIAAWPLIMALTEEYGSSSSTNRQMRDPVPSVNTIGMRATGDPDFRGDEGGADNTSETSTQAKKLLDPEQEAGEFLPSLQSLVRIIALYSEGGTQSKNAVVEITKKANRLASAFDGRATLRITTNTVFFADGTHLIGASAGTSSLLSAMHDAGIKSISLSFPVSKVAVADLASLIAGVSSKHPQGSIEINGSLDSEARDGHVELGEDRPFKVQTIHREESESGDETSLVSTSSDVVATDGEKGHATTPLSPLSPADRVALLGRLGDLRDRNVLTDEEFEVEKRKLLGS